MAASTTRRRSSTAGVIDDVPPAGPRLRLDDVAAWPQPAADGDPDADAGFDIFS